ncbi:MAG: hypothetical protein Q8Q20_04885 [bacterium]|nr:hypothetical protein [bacterium]
MENLNFSLDEVFNEIITKMETQGSFDKAVREQLIDEVLQDKLSDGLLPDDYDFKQAHEKLEYMLAEHLKEEGFE